MSRAERAVRGDIRISTLTADRAGEAGRLLTASHAAYPAFEKLFTDRDRRRKVLESFMTATSRDAAKHALALAAEDDLGLVGVALWMPPGSVPLTVARKMPMMPAMLRIGLRAPTALPRFARVGASLERALPDEPLWYLQVLGVHPRAQRSGVGGRLVRRGLARADDAGLRCHLYTSDPANVAYYERFGFAVVECDIRIGNDGPRYIAMSRPTSVGSSVARDVPD